MENNGAIDNFLKSSMSFDGSGLAAPDHSIVIKAREKVLSRKKIEKVGKDIFYLFAKFLDRKVKLQYAVIVAIFIGMSLLYFSKEKVVVNNDNNLTETNYIASLNSVSSPSVLLCITTFAIRN